MEAGLLKKQKIQVFLKGKGENMKKRIVSVLMSLIIIVGMFQFGVLNVKAAPTINIGNLSSSPSANVKKVNITKYSVPKLTSTLPIGSYSADVSYVLTLKDYKNRINVVQTDNTAITIERYDSNGNYQDKISITPQFPLFGTVTCDSNGYYYVITGKETEAYVNGKVINVSKYDYSGSFIKACEIMSADTSTWGDDFATKMPFHAGSCRATVNNGVLCVNHARLMYSGHQSNYVIYVDTSSMQRIIPSGSFYSVPYVSHSFDQRVVGIQNGNFLVLNQGDAYYRGFEIAKVDSSKGYAYKEMYNFHFREGANRSYGYNETFAQLGGIAETSASYVFCASSERTFSSDATPNTGYLVPNEARDLFVQFIRKDFDGSTGADQYTVNGEKRSLTGSGTAPEKRLTGSEEDNGVIWLTDLDDSQYVLNPKILSTDDDKVVIMWEVGSYSSNWYYSSRNDSFKAYYTVLDKDGTVLTPVMTIPDVTLAKDAEPEYMSGKIYWATNDGNNAYLNILTIQNNQPIDHESVNNFVTRLYRKCFGREPDSDGFNYWTKSLENREANGASIGAFFVFSDEYKTMNSNSTDYIKMLYEVFMGRGADNDGLEFWLGEIEHGMTREMVFKKFVESDEYTQICYQCGIERGDYSIVGIPDPEPTIKDTVQIRNYVERIYNKALDRVSDEEGISYWTSQIAAGKWEPVAVAEYFIISDEFESKGYNDVEYVKILYRTFMGREYDDEGLQYWCERLQNGDTKKTVLEAFAGCDEFRAIVESFGL